MRKVTQVMSHMEKIIALCDDGTIWRLGSGAWSEITSIPQYDNFSARVLVGGKYLDHHWDLVTYRNRARLFTDKEDAEIAIGRMRQKYPTKQVRIEK